MYFLLSGEGPTDLGACRDGAAECNGVGFRAGPMAIIVDQIVENELDFSMLESEWFGFVGERRLADRAAELRSARKSMSLPGRKRAKETRYFFANARILSRIAQERQSALGDEVVAILFRDSDGTASAGRGLWDDKRRSMLDGFAEEGFARGVPMIPKPKSELPGRTGGHSRCSRAFRICSPVTTSRRWMSVTFHFPEINRQRSRQWDG